MDQVDREGLEEELRRLRADNERLRAVEEELRATRAHLSESEARYRSVVEALSDGVVLHDHDGQIKAFNTAALRVLGLDADQLTGRTSMDPNWRCVHRDGRPFPGEDHPGLKTLKTGESYSDVLMGVYKPDGHLSWISINSRTIDQPDSGGRFSVVASFCDVTQQVLGEDRLREEQAALRRALGERELLLQELHHRSRNNMQVIRSLLDLEADRPERTVRELIRDVGHRILAMEMVHELLHKATDLKQVRMDRYAEVLLPALYDGYGMDQDRVRARLDVDPVLADVRVAMPLGLVLAELVMNALKHGFPGGRVGEIRVSIGPSGDQRATVVVSDDGVGGVSEEPGRTSVGLGLVRRIVEGQLGGRLSWSHESGTTCRIDVPLEV